MVAAGSGWVILVKMNPHAVSHAGPAQIDFPTGLLSRRTVELGEGVIIVTDRTLGGSHERRIEAAKLLPEPVRVERKDRMIPWLIAIAIGGVIITAVDWDSRRLAITPRALTLTASWALLAWLLSLHYTRRCGRFLTWTYAVSRRPAIEIPARIADRLDIAAFLRIPTLPKQEGAALEGTTDDRLRQLDALLTKGHITDEEYRILRRRTMEAHRRAPI